MELTGRVAVVALSARRGGIAPDAATCLGNADAPGSCTAPVHGRRFA